MSDCLKLSVAQKDALVAQGWTVLGGPYTNQDECLVGCGSTTTTGEPSTTTTGGSTTSTGEPSTTTSAGSTTSTGEPSTTTTLPVRYICIDGICTETYEVGPGTFSTLAECQAVCGGGGSTTSTGEPSTTTTEEPSTTSQEPTTTTTAPPCNICLDSLPATWTVNASGFSKGNGWCVDCSSFNGTFTATAYRLQNCKWRSPTQTVCGHTWCWEVALILGTPSYLECHLLEDGLVLVAYADLNWDRNCCVSKVVPFVSDNGQSACENVPASVTVTADCAQTTTTTQEPSTTTSQGAPTCNYCTGNVPIQWDLTLTSPIGNTFSGTNCGNYVGSWTVYAVSNCVWQSAPFAGDSGHNFYWRLTTDRSQNHNMIKLELIDVSTGSGPVSWSNNSFFGDCCSPYALTIGSVGINCDFGANSTITVIPSGGGCAPVTTTTQGPSTSTSQGSTTTTQPPFVTGYYCCRMDDVPNSWDCRHLNNSSGLVLGSGPYATLEECQAQSLCGGGTTTTSEPSTTTTGGSTTSTQEPSTTTTLAPCPACTQNPPPQTWDFTIAGLTGNCAQLNGDYTLNYVGECEWRTGPITFTNGECTDNSAYFKMTWDGNLFKWIIAFHSTCFTDLLDWYSSTGYDCCEAKLFVGHNYGCSGVQDFVAVSACTPPTTTTTQPGSTTTQPGSTTTTQPGCSGPHTTACCPGGLPDTLVLHAGTDSYTLTWDGWGSWTTGQDWRCPMPVSLTCPYDVVVLSPFGISPVSGSCATGWNFGNVDFSGVGCSFSPSTRATTVSCGGGGSTTTTVQGSSTSTTSQGSSSSGEGSSSSSAHGTIATNCCPSNLLPATLHSNIGDFVYQEGMYNWWNNMYDIYLWCDAYSNSWVLFFNQSYDAYYPIYNSCSPTQIQFEVSEPSVSGIVNITG